MVAKIFRLKVRKYMSQMRDSGSTSLTLRTVLRTKRCGVKKPKEKELGLRPEGVIRVEVIRGSSGRGKNFVRVKGTCVYIA